MAKSGTGPFEPPGFQTALQGPRGFSGGREERNWGALSTHLQTITTKDPATLLLGTALLTAQRWRPPKHPSTDEWIKEMCDVHAQP